MSAKDFFPKFHFFLILNFIDFWSVSHLTFTTSLYKLRVHYGEDNLGHREGIVYFDRFDRSFLSRRGRVIRFWVDESNDFVHWTLAKSPVLRTLCRYTVKRWLYKSLTLFSRMISNCNGTHPQVLGWIPGNFNLFTSWFLFKTERLIKFRGKMYSYHYRVTHKLWVITESSGRECIRPWRCLQFSISS